MQAPHVSPEFFHAVLTNTSGFRTAVSDYMNSSQHACRPAVGSQLERECQGFSDPEAVITAYDHGTLIIKLVADQLVALVRELSPPYLSLASWTTLRMILESAALSSWLLDPSVDPMTRVRRSFAHRFKGLMERKGIAKSMSPDDLREAERQLNALVASADALGFPLLFDKKNQRNGAGERMPNSTNLVTDILGQGQLYKILSAFVHGHHWAYIRLSFTQTDDGTGKDATVVQRMEPFHMVGHLTFAALWLARPVWYQSRLNGGDLPALAQILDRHFVDGYIEIKEEKRFWRSSVTCSG